MSGKTRGRPKSDIPYIVWKIHIPAPLAFQIEVRMVDPVTGTAAYGKRSQLLQALLYEWLEKQKALASVASEHTAFDTQSEKADNKGSEILASPAPLNNE